LPGLISAAYSRLGPAGTRKRSFGARSVLPRWAVGGVFAAGRARHPGFQGYV